MSSEKPVSKYLLEHPESNPAQAWVADRVATRPALAALTGLLASFPVIKVFASNAVPLIMWREGRAQPTNVR
ncbi:Hypothetical protein PP7435_CHR2-0355 [Komagataella phaffii CBS 7435]|uniref:Uncharacterized protein n=2 Tax=Komagataella phaffii TaxID=460519 RepID=C4R247_KOMPG|nr:Hypothetical protein PAS_chr2-2_0335 [Komagataella phaffii GS115]CAH2447882.1 Hypothetical protein BQ9382_C2-1950 [Komagataella phaffii CBS 7435]CAY69571.1 Hypothetical protein PAS_chr2-2_0335 [Komagataella phaffii GS115]CCA38049.1 Hypothetical protein PP7435_CHR2-0355 [Komagataella phaffii CBS 7435]